MHNNNKINDLADKIQRNIYQGVQNDLLDNDKLVQIIELAGSLLNLQTISAYAENNKLSYNGVKKHRQIINIFGCKFVIDNL